MAQLRDEIMDSATYETTVLREANDLARGAKRQSMIATLLREEKVGAGQEENKKEEKEAAKKALTAVSKNTLTKWAMDKLVPYSLQRRCRWSHGQVLWNHCAI